MIHRTNADRAERAYASLSRYDGEVETDIIDLMSDLLHLAREHGMDPKNVVRLAEMHFEAEEEEETDHGMSLTHHG